MTVWLFRAGKHGEYEELFLNEGRIYLTWDKLSVNLSRFSEKEEIYNWITQLYGLEKKQKARNWASQIWPIAHRMKKGDWIVLPSKINRTIHIGEIRSDYKFKESYANPYYHYREVEWFAQDIPRDRFDQDLLYSFGAFMTVCKISRNHAESRLQQMRANNWYTTKTPISEAFIDEEAEAPLDLEEYIYDQISQRIIQRFQGDQMEVLIESILRAKGFTTYHSPKGADNGVDILASSDSLGFGSPRICVQVKSSDTPLDRPKLDQLIGTMNNFNAEFGLMVSWSGFKSSIMREIPKQFFKVRLWDAKTVIDEIFANYEHLNDEIKKEIPLKQIWMLDTENDL